jgi:hypothetical protein
MTPHIMAFISVFFYQNSCHIIIVAVRPRLDSMLCYKKGVFTLFIIFYIIYVINWNRC